MRLHWLVPARSEVCLCLWESAIPRPRRYVPHFLIFGLVTYVVFLRKVGQPVRPGILNPPVTLLISADIIC